MDKIIPITLSEKFELALCKEEQVSCPVRHHFGPGIYIREVFIPAGTLSIGHYQTHEHLNIFLKGRITMINEDGSSYDIQAPMIFTSPPGRKMGYIHEDMTWLNIYSTEEKDIEVLENTYLRKSDVWKDIQPDLIKREADRQDFYSFLASVGLTDEIVRKQSENTDDLTDLPDGTYEIGIFDSAIEGKGVFATADITSESVIAPARLNNLRTPVGRYTNHSMDPNAIMVKLNNGDIYLQSIKPIKGYRGGIIGDEITVNYRQVLEMHKGA